MKNSQNNNNNMAVLESTAEANIFWLSIILADIIWVTFFIISLLTFSFKWMVCVVAFHLFVIFNFNLLNHIYLDNYTSCHNVKWFEHIRIFEMSIRL